MKYIRLSDHCFKIIFMLELIVLENDDEKKLEKKNETQFISFLRLIKSFKRLMRREYA